MKIEITAVYTDKFNTLLVDFRSHIGECKAIWVGQKPILGNSYDIEIDVVDKLLWGENILLYNGETFKIQYKDDHISLVGKLIAVEEKGCAVTKLDNDIMLLETFGEPFEVGRFIEILPHKIVAYEIAL
jgi:hypothetical protein